MENKDSLIRQWRDYVNLVDPNKHLASDWWLNKIEAQKAAFTREVEGVRDKVNELKMPEQITSKENIGLIDYGFQMAQNHTLTLLDQLKTKLK
jgi:hypothetical protein